MTSTPRRIADRRRAFKQLHEAGCFILPNPWGVGSARYPQGLGFKALATTSSGLAWSLGRPDNSLARGLSAQHPDAQFIVHTLAAPTRRRRRRVNGDALSRMRIAKGVALRDRC